MLLVCSCETGKKEEKLTFKADPDCIQIVLFHLSQRCESCIAVEMETRTILDKMYKEELASGKIRFLSFNFLSENGQKAATQLKAYGQNLFIVLGDRVSDLSGPAFLYAHTHPERYHEALTKELEKYLE